MLSIEDNARTIDREFETGRSIVDGLPYYYQVHLHMPCNQKCIMCVPDGRHPRDTMSFESFSRILDRISGVAKILTLIGGETLLYPHIEDVLERLGRHRMEVNIITNATMLTEALCERLIGLHRLNLKCSVDAASADTYYRIRGTDVFDRVKRNLEMFAGMTKGMEHIRRIMVYVVMRRNLHEVLPFIDFASTLAPHEIQFHPVRHVSSWSVDNGTGWHFDGAEQSCESFRETYLETMRRAQERCSQLAIRCETLPV
ncbi:MAG: radical SAM protein [Proteobacteria bacterium]|nr:MAG: radical SAM protein [Pseudomonadota bacterium]